MMDDLRQIEGKPDLDRAMLVLSIADITGIRSDAGVRIDGGPLMPFEPGMKTISSFMPGSLEPYASPARLDSGVNRPIGRALVESGFTFAVDLSLNGSGSFAIAPAGQTTRFSAEANWPHPGFEGLFLPEEKSIDGKGFSAKWTIPYLARGVDRVVSGSVLPLSNSLMAVNMVEPVKFYQVVARTLKYSVGFFSVVFLAVFIIELKSARKVHWIQYVLTGLALVVFYILLLALAEHTGFEIAYLLASVATAGLISSYVGSVTGSVRRGAVLAFVLGAAYAVMYLILREDEYALLAGALISFVTIAATMFSTRNIDWSGVAKRS
jgi:inner membrane protein